MRKIRAKKGEPIAIKAGARKIATAYYNILTKGIEYVQEGSKNDHPKTTFLVLSDNSDTKRKINETQTAS